MPWTPKQVRLLLSDASPLSDAQKSKMRDELHQDPAMGHARKGSAALKRPAAKPSPKKKQAPETESYAYNWRQHMGRPR